MADFFTPLTDLPQRKSVNFVSQVDALFGTKLPAFVVEANAVLESISTAPAAQWVSGTTYAAGVCVWSPATYQTYRRKSAGAGTTDPSADPTNYQLITWRPTATRSARTSNTALAEADRGKLIQITSGTFSQTFNACSTLGDGWYCYIANTGTGDITLDPNSTEQIDGASTLILYPGHVRLVVCTGTALFSVLLAGKRLLVVRDEKTSGTAAQSLTTAAGYQQRTLNTVAHNTIEGASLASNRITLPAGRYFVQARVPAYTTSSFTGHKAQLYNYTGSASLLLGSSGGTTATYIVEHSTINGVFSLASSSEVEIRHKIMGANTTGGAPATTGDAECYTEIIIERLQ